jgi:SAM-dependent methyltransferase
MGDSLSYANQKRHSAEERIKPGRFHSRYVHLNRLRDGILNIANKHLSKEDILVDLGCGEIPYLQFIEPKVKEYIGVDIPGNPKAKAFVDLDTNRTNLEDNSADVVWSVQVLEHVSDYHKYLQECYRLLKPGKKLILCTHGHWLYHPDPIDYWRWTSAGLKVTLERAGFEVIEQTGMMGLLSMSLQLYQDAVLKSFPLVKLWGGLFCGWMQFWIGMAEKYYDRKKVLRDFRDKDACVYFMVAVKK